MKIYERFLLVIMCWGFFMLQNNMNEALWIVVGAIFAVAGGVGFVLGELLIKESN